MPRKKLTQAQKEKELKRKKKIAERKLQQATADAAGAGAGAGADAVAVAAAAVDEQPKRDSPRQSPKRTAAGRIIGEAEGAADEESEGESEKTTPKRQRQSPPKPQGTPSGLSSPFRRASLKNHQEPKDPAAGEPAVRSIADDDQEAPEFFRGKDRALSPSPSAFFRAGGGGSAAAAGLYGANSAGAGSARGKGRGDEVAAGADEEEGEESHRCPLGFDVAVHQVAMELQRDVVEASVSLSGVRDDRLYDCVKGVSYMQPNQCLGQWTLEYDPDRVEPCLLVKRASDDKSYRVYFYGDQSYCYERDPEVRRPLVQQWLDDKYRDLSIEYMSNALSAYPLKKDDVDRFMAEFEAEKRGRIEGKAGEMRYQRKERLLRDLLSRRNYPLLYCKGSKEFRADKMNDKHMIQHMAVGGRSDKTHLHPCVGLGSVYLAGFNIIIDNSMRQFLHWAHKNNVVIKGKATFIVNFGMPIDKGDRDGWQYAHVESEGAGKGHFYPVDENDFRSKKTFIVLDRYGRLDREFYQLSFGRDPITLVIDPHTRNISERFERTLALRIPSPSTPAAAPPLRERRGFLK